MLAVNFCLLLMWMSMVLNLCVNIPCFKAVPYDDVEIRFRQFITDYNRTYAGNSAEYAKRLAIFAVSSYHALCQL